MKKIIILASGLLYSLVSLAQTKNYIAYLGPYNLDRNKSFALNEDRKAYMTQEMYAQANASQKQLLGYLNSNTIPHKSFFVVNAVSIKANENAIQAIKSAFPELEIIDVSEWKYKAHTPVHMGEAEPISVGRAAGAPEPGLLAVGARSMWNRGYSGKGVKVLSFDTGVWPDHPAISSQFMANNYPYSQTWQGYFAQEPADKTSSHGTHTIGTMLGLYKPNNDTLGLAFKGYYFATDPIVSNLAFLLPLDSIIGAYNWSLNPDGNIATAYDIPDVICNSWGWVDPPDPNLCTGFMADMLDNIELAGIANEYSAGNEGPGATTVGAPAMVSNNLVNAFSVGAVNAHNAAYPIASFSSRGPGVCGNNPSLIIKPEVVAPGVSVRSCVGTNAYSAYDGTSMAGPHVAGALMLLREAFPQATAKELKEALYFTADDLGDPGEDDTYGMGMINLDNAYNYLINEGYTAAIPADQDNDLEVVLLNAPSKWACDTEHTPTYRIINRSSHAINQLTITISHNGNTLFNTTQSINIAAGDSTLFTLGQPIQLQDGRNEIWASFTQTEFAERDVVNNNNTYRTYFTTPNNLPYTQTFNSKVGDFKNWEIRNPDGLRTWELLPAQGLQFNDSAAVIRNPAYTTNSNGMIDDLISPPVQIPNSNNVYVSFWVAFHKRLANQRDTVQLMVESDCKNSFTNSIYNMTVQNAATYDLSNPVLFVPSTNEHWKRHIVQIPAAYVNQKVYFNFRSKSYKGGSFWLGQFAVHEGEDFVSVPVDKLKDAIKIYPNPAESYINIEGEGINSVRIIDMQGKLILAQHNINSSNLISLNVEALSKGVYTIHIVSNSGSNYFKFIR